MYIIHYIIFFSSFLTSLVYNFYFGLPCNSRLPVTKEQPQTSDVKVYFFLSVDCPICVYYGKIIAHMVNSLHGKADVNLVFPQRGDTQREIQAFCKKYSIAATCIKDARDKLVNMYRVTTTPEVIVIKNNKVLYSGAIDNAYVDVSLRRNVVTEFYLQEVINSLTKGELPSYNRIEPVGCILMNKRH